MREMLFWDVDTQYDFMRDDDDHQGALAIPGAKDIEPRLAQLIRYARSRNIPIVHTRDSHQPDSPELSDSPDFLTTFPPHCMAGTRGERNIPSTEPKDALLVDWRASHIDTEKVCAAQEIVITKDRFDCFTGSPHSEHVLDLLMPDHIVVFGVATNVCVNQAVLGMLRRNYRVSVVTDAIKELPNLPVAPIIEEWKKQGVDLTTVKRVISR